MSANAIAFRRIIRSIGQNVPPAGVEGAAGNVPGGACWPLDISNQSGWILSPTRGGHSGFRGRRLKPREHRRYQHARSAGPGELENSQAEQGHREETSPTYRRVQLRHHDIGHYGPRHLLDREVSAPTGSGQAVSPRAPGTLGQRAERASGQNESETGSPAVANSRAEGSEQYDEAKQRTSGRQAASGRRAAVQSKKEAKDKMRPAYFASMEAAKERRAKQTSLNRKMLRERQTYPEDRAWQDAFNILVRESQAIKNQFGRRTEKVSLPQGIVAKWSRDPGESILEISQRTGCTVRTLPSNEDDTAFPSLTLWGTTDENASATRLLRESDLLVAIGRDDLDASQKFADHKVHIEVTETHARDAEMMQRPLDRNEDFTERSDEPPHTGIVRNVSSRAPESDELPPTHAVWARPMIQRNHFQFLWDATNGSWKLTEDFAGAPPQSPAVSSPVAFGIKIRALTRSRPLREYPLSGRGSTGQNTSLIVTNKLVSLFTDKDNAAVITTESVMVAFKWLAQNMQFPAIRSLLEHFESAKIELRANAIEPLLFAAQRSINMNAFCSYVRFMQKRAIKPSPTAWITFRQLTQSVNPSKVSLVYQRMLQLGVYEHTTTKIRSFDAIAPELLLAYIQTYPQASFKRFVSDTVGSYSQITRMSTTAANRMINTALENGKINIAFEVVDTLVKQKGKPDTFTLNAFLTAARRDESVELATTVLKKFHELRVLHRPMADNSSTNEPLAANLSTARNLLHQSLSADATSFKRDGPARPATLTRNRDLSVYLNDVSFSLLLATAWERRSWNAFRVFWRYACMAGYKDSRLSGKMFLSLKTGAKHQWQAVPFRRYVHGRRVQGDVPKEISRAMLWDLWAARFAVGVADGVETDNPELPKAGSSYRRLALEFDDASSPTATPDPEFFSHWRDILDTDQAEVRFLEPLRSISTLAELAVRKDVEWKSQLLGLPKGLREAWGSDGRRGMLEFMLETAIRVPVAVGEGTRIRA